ncbi:MAG: FKBP-type peptidyl-prolyl cis-trans isomerase [Lutibacter sp.]|nr:FKBP-type peptidyl-prolyl cis-trans isomerase [Lutibacter sp.]
MKRTYLSIFLITALAVFSCGEDTGSNDFDAAAQSLTDDAALIDYLQTHYLNEDDGGIWTISAGETPLMDAVQSQTVVNNDVSYTLYRLMLQEGVMAAPTRADSVLVTYTGMLMDSTVFDSSSNRLWFSLTSVVDGWSHGLTNFKAGQRVVNPDESFYYENSGEGFLFIPSGLAYANAPQVTIPENSPLIFKITLNDVNDADHDQDGILSIDEDLDGDGNVKNDDTDGDGTADYLDTDNS